jgi:hypothetical protein
MKIPPVDFNKLNNIIAQTSDVVCDETCQKDRTTNKLRKKYDNAVHNADTAPHQVDVAFKKYITFSQGETSYNETIARQIRQNAEEMKKTALQSFQNSINATKKTIHSYNIIHTNYNNVKNLHTRLVKKNNKTELLLRNKTSDSLVNDRKSYYDNQQLDNLKWYASILRFVYGCITLGFIMSFVFLYVKNNVFNKDILIWSITLVIFPFISMPLYNRILQLLSSLKNLSKINV